MKDLAPPPQVQRCADCANSPKNQRAEEIALALMGVGTLDPDHLSEAVGWDKSGAPAVMGHEAVLRGITPCGASSIVIDQVVSHGKAGAVSGMLHMPDGQTRLFCHMIRFTSAAAKTVAHIVSFEHGGKVG